MQAQSEIILSNQVEPELTPLPRTKVTETHTETALVSGLEPEPKPVVIEAELTQRSAPVPPKRKETAPSVPSRLPPSSETTTSESSKNGEVVVHDEQVEPNVMHVTSNTSYLEPVPPPVIDPEIEGVTLNAMADEPPLIIDTKPRKVAPPMPEANTVQSYRAGETLPSARQHSQARNGQVLGMNQGNCTFLFIH